MAQLQFVLGGVRSGKSRWAEQLAAAHGPVTYVATALAGDGEMTERIAKHRERRPADWRTIEEPWALPAVVAQQQGTVLVECLSLWLTNLLVGVLEHPPQDDGTIRQAVAEFCGAARETAASVIVVSNETGCGIMPMNALARRFGDLLGEANQAVAAAADVVWWCVAGIPQRIKG